MENNNLGILGKKKDKSVQNKNGIQDSKDQHRIMISKEVNTSVEQVVLMVNSGFEAGAVTKSDVANYILLNQIKLISDTDIRGIRAQHFDAKKALGAMLKSSEDLPEDVQKALRAACGIAETNKKKASKSAPELSTESSVDNSRAG